MKKLKTLYDTILKNQNSTENGRPKLTSQTKIVKIIYRP